MVVGRRRSTPLLGNPTERSGRSGFGTYCHCIRRGNQGIGGKTAKKNYFLRTYRKIGDFGGKVGRGEGGGGATGNGVLRKNCVRFNLRFRVCCVR